MNKGVELADRLAERSAHRKISVLFVCLGNICRSPAAQAVFGRIIDDSGLSSRFMVDSAGLYGGHAGELPDKRMRVHAFQRGYHLDHRSRPVRLSDYDDFDIIIGMDDSNYDNLRRLAPTPEAEQKVVRIADFFRHHPHADCIPDPYYEGAEGFEIALDLIEDASSHLMELLIPNS
ncbi:MAG: low molecular weight phosphotyrosine protein phosphatase [Clostridium sp.]|nr:low molecular weight phosphotyrosine protein phosphatase [Prevotella sp.]MCM1429372.1 low molecular weight phosphotyrosine protein phosphatase [Clostridium sp.]MCM1475593.1 low molecular weight phosphotyrosine protein phosphatase [Muribaculaceae bacterium]